MCGLKLFATVTGIKTCVTPHVGVWIETEIREIFSQFLDVTPHVGVWIETDKPADITLDNRSHLM